MLQQTSKLIEIISNQHQRTEEDGQKRKKGEEINYNPQEPVLLFEESYKIEDDGHNKIDTSLRQRLRPINTDPAEWWVKGAFKRVDRPILGAALYLEYLIPGSVNEWTHCKVCDRSYMIPNSIPLCVALYALSWSDSSAKDTPIISATVRYAL